MGCKAVIVRGRRCDWPGWTAGPNPSLSFGHLVSQVARDAARLHALRQRHRRWGGV